MLMEVMGLHLPGAAFVNPNTPLRDALTAAATQARGRRSPRSATNTRRSATSSTSARSSTRIVGLLATGGSTNHTLHLVAMARAAGIVIDWDDFSDLSEVVPLLARIYPNGKADVNHFHAAGGMGFLIAQLLDAGLLHADVTTVAGQASRATPRAVPARGRHRVARGAGESGDRDVLRGDADPFSADGGLKLLSGNLGKHLARVSCCGSTMRKSNRASSRSPGVMSTCQRFPSHARTMMSSSVKPYALKTVPAWLMTGSCGDRIPE